MSTISNNGINTQRNNPNGFNNSSTIVNPVALRIEPEMDAMPPKYTITMISVDFKMVNIPGFI